MTPALLLLVAAVFFASALDYSQVQVSNTRYDPYPAEPGKYITAYIDSYNLGTIDAHNVEFTLLPQYPFSLDPGDNASVFYDIMRPGGSALVQYRLRIASDAADGTNKLGYRLSYDGFRTAEGFVSIQVTRKNTIGISRVTPTLVKPGEQTPLVFTLQNLGNSPAEGITIGWDESSKLIVPIGTENHKFLTLLAAHEELNATFEVVADPAIAPGVYSLNVTISYSEGNVTRTVPTKVGIIVGGQADFDAAIQGYSNGQLSLAIANIGSNPAAAVSVTLPLQPGVIVTGPSTQFLGNLLRGDFTLASFQVQTPQFAGTGGAAPGSGSGGSGADASPGGSGAGGSNQNNSQRGRRFGGFASNPGGLPGFGGNASDNSLLVKIEYTDTLGKRQSVPRSLSFAPELFSSQMQGRQFGRNNGLPGGLPWYAYTAAAILLAAIGWWAYKKHLKKPKAITAVK